MRLFMATITLKHEINCDAETFWKLFVDDEFNDRLYRDVLQFPEFKVVEQRETETEIIRNTQGRPKMNVPAPVAKLLGSSFGYLDEGRLDKKTGTWRFKITPTILAGKLRNEGTVRIEPAGEGKVRRLVEIIIEAKVFGVGGMLESATEKETRDGWEKSAKFMNEWIAKPKA